MSFCRSCCSVMLSFIILSIMQIKWRRPVGLCLVRDLSDLFCEQMVFILLSFFLWNSPNWRPEFVLHPETKTDHINGCFLNKKLGGEKQSSRFSLFTVHLQDAFPRIRDTTDHSMIIPSSPLSSPPQSDGKFFWIKDIHPHLHGDDLGLHWITGPCRWTLNLVSLCVFIYFCIAMVIIQALFPFGT